MMTQPEYRQQRELLQLLQGRDARGIRELAGKLSLSGDDIKAIIRDLQALGVALESGEHGLCRLDAPFELLDEDTLRNRLPGPVNESLESMHLHWITDSTNQRLMDLPPPPPGRARVCIAEYQQAGRGRHGRSWQAPLGGSLCLSVAWTFSRATPELAGLGIAVGVAVRTALDRCGVKDVQFKWPNDLLWGQRKLGGVLLETRTSHDAGAAVVAGIGLNFALDANSREAIVRLGGLAPVDVVEAGCGAAVSRNTLAARVITRVVHALVEFTDQGLEPFVADWRAADAYQNQPVLVSTPKETLAGVARGIDASGALRLEKDGHIERIISAEVSLRPA